MRTIIAGVFFSIIFASNLLAQPNSLWSRTFGTDRVERCYSVLQTTDGGYALAGYNNSIFPFSNSWLIKTDSLGSSVWNREYGGYAGEICYSLRQTPDGGFVLAGNTSTFGAGNGDFWLVKTDASGDSLWSHPYGGSSNESCACVRLTADGGYVMAGHTYSFGAGSADFWLVKVDSDGDSLWSHTYGGSAADECKDVLQTADGGYVMAGHTLSYGPGMWDFWLVKTDAEGNQLWSQTYGGGNSGEQCFTVLQVSEGGFLLAGSKEAIGSTSDFWLVRTDADGNMLWNETYNGGRDDVCNEIRQTPDGGYILVGSRELTTTQYSDFWIVRTGSSGTMLWSSSYGASGANDYGTCMDLTDDGGYVYAGYTNSYGAGGSDFWMIKTEPDLLQSPPGPFERVFPVDSSYVEWPLDTFTWTYSIDPNGDTITYLFHLESNMPDFTPVDVSTPDTFLMFDWAHSGGTLDEVFEFHWTVHAAANGDTVEATNGEGIYFYDTSEPPGPFERVHPEDSTFAGWDEQYVEMNWTPSIDPNGDDVTYLLHVSSPTFDWIPMPIDTVLSDTLFTFEAPFVDRPNLPLDDIYEFYWTVHAAANSDSVEASNGEGYFLLDRTGAADGIHSLPAEFNLSVYPNPFNPSTTITFDIPQQTEASLIVYDLLGRQIAQLMNGNVTAGTHQIKWNGSSCATGLYLIELKTGNYQKITKAMLLR